ncbi:MAG: ATP-grasp domain-containing protein [Methylophilus sp.]|nr:ATP-grasp domain-containing protein [Methylophilus sp.]
MQSKPTIVIAAISSRPYVKAATEAGFEVIAIDMFADRDTQNLAKKVYQVGLHENQFDLEALLDVLDEVSVHQPLGFCYGSGFERHPEHLAQIEAVMPVFGNRVEAIQSCKNPQSFFKLCDALSIAYPEVSHAKPVNHEGWLRKQIGGCGGSHVSALDVCFDEETQGIYYQRHQSGIAIACLFLVCEQAVRVIGFHEQWVSQQAPFPYQYGGAVSHITLDDWVKSEMESFVKAAAKTWGLVGLNSCDAILADDKLYMLEINPRLSASVDLYTPVVGNLFAAHVAASKKETVGDLVISTTAKAHHVYYAQHEMLITESFNWPHWVCDIPEVGQRIEKNRPLCTVIAQAETATQAKQLVQNRARLFN